MTQHALPFYEPSGNEIALFEHAWRERLPLLIKGPTGCGKTRFVSHMAARLGLPLHTVACHDDLTAADLVGRHLISDQGTYWCDGPLTRAVREGGICYLDEVVEARKDTTVVLHPLADDRRILPIDRTGEILEAPPGFMLVVSYNPGYQNLLKGLKPSTRQRFVSTRFDFPTAEREQSILIGETGCDADLARRYAEVKAAVEAGRLGRLVLAGVQGRRSHRRRAGAGQLRAAHAQHRATRHRRLRARRGRGGERRRLRQRPRPR